MSSVLIAPSRAPNPSPEEARRGETDPPWAAPSSRVYLPAAAIATLAAVLVGFGWSDHWGGDHFTGSLTSLRAVLVGPLTVGMIGIVLIMERIWPAQQRPLFARGYRHDLLLTAVNVLLVAPLVTALTLSSVDVVRRTLPWIVLPRIGALPRWGAIAAIVVGMDGCNWFVHRANHRVRMLWRFHELHHSQEDMNVLTVFRTHPLIHVSYLVALLPGLALLANGAMSVTVLAVYGGIVAFAHSNTRVAFGPLGRIIVSPNYHRIHHRLDGPQGVNLGFALTIWDQMFHSRGVPHHRDGQDRHRTAGPAAEGRTGGSASAASRRPRRAAGGTLPPDARRHGAVICSIAPPSALQAGVSPRCWQPSGRPRHATSEVT